MASTIAKTFRLPTDVVQLLKAEANSTEYVVNAIREKARRDQELAIEASLACLAMDEEANDISDLRQGQAKVIDRID